MLKLIEQKLYGSVDVTSPKIRELRQKILNKHQDEVILGKTITGNQFVARINDSYAIDFIFGSQSARFFCEPFTTQLAYDLASKSNGSVVCAGAHIGGLVIPIASQADKVFCFEPDPFSFRLLQLNLLLNNVSNVVAREMALSNMQGFGRLIGEDASSHFLFSENNRNGIFCDTLDAIYDDSANGPLALLQLDAEGGEQSILVGAANLIREYKPAIICEIHMTYDDFSIGLGESSTVKKLHSFGYDVFAIRDYNTHFAVSEAEPAELLRVEDVMTHGPPHGFNLLAIEKEKASEVLGKLNILIVEKPMSPKLMPERFEPEFQRYLKH